MCAINDHKLIVIIVKSVNIHIRFILCRKSFLPAYAQLGMLGTIFAMVPLVALTVTARVTEQTKCYTSTPTSTSLRMVDPEIFSVNSNLQKFFYTFLTPPHPSDDKNQRAASSVHSKTTSQERVYTVIVDIVY